MTAEVAPDIETSSEAYARRFAGKAGRMFLDRQEALVARALVDKQAVSILDVGGGHAQLSGPLAALGHRVTVVGSTPECAMRLAHDARNAAVTFNVGALHDLPFEDRSFDTVTSIRTMAHIENWHVFLSELCRVASRSVVIDYPEIASFNVLSLATFGVKKKIEGDTRRYRNFSAATLRRELAASGFCVSFIDRQFLLPMALHRAAGGNELFQTFEKVARVAGMTRIAGNPGILRADRR